MGRTQLSKSCKVLFIYCTFSRFSSNPVAAAVQSPSHDCCLIQPSLHLQQRFGSWESFIFASFVRKYRRSKVPFASHLPTRDWLFLRTVIPSVRSSRRMWGLIGRRWQPRQLERDLRGVWGAPTAGDPPEAALGDPRWRGCAPGSSRRQGRRGRSRLGDAAGPLAGVWAGRWAAERGGFHSLGGVLNQRGLCARRPGSKWLEMWLLGMYLKQSDV